MKLNAHQTNSKAYKFNLNIVAILFSITWAIIEFFWRLPFTFGTIGGIYWLLYYFEKLSSPLSILEFVMALLLFGVAIVMQVTKRSQYSGMAKTAGAFFLASLIIGLATFQPIQPAETRHLDALDIHSRLYYLTAYSALDTNYALYTCDSKGVFCKQIYRSNDFTPYSFDAKLVYYSATDEVAIETKDEGEIYRYKIP